MNSVYCDYCGLFLEFNDYTGKKIINHSENCASCKDAKICLKCMEMTENRAKSSSFYKSYIKWCDSCIWFDIS